MRFRTITVLAVLATSIGHTARPLSGAAQLRFASITGRVVGGSSGEPADGVPVALVTLGRRTVTDSNGQFAFRDLEAGTYRIEAGPLGVVPLSATVSLRAGEHKDVEFRLDGASERMPVVAAESATASLVGVPASPFERRRASGGGRYFDRDDILERRPFRLTDLLRQLPGVRVHCQGGACVIRLNQDPRGCAPAVFLDEQRSPLSALDTTAPEDVHGLEIYRGPSETPPELNNDQARCGGAIAISTRRG